ncbi:ras-responsive element-binding protein 1-like isoform X2 [Pecten maximus]|uniref:ras-responsive element-binding protein 1-like isoform X2 n=1 Tax=Pecten maximus TaxID=6579 RepID=UPI00145828B9|nr:ras-responsive element-binding protein 1-like isoform X2 [Pecten maximus]
MPKSSRRKQSKPQHICSEEEDESPTKSTRKSSVHKKAISDDNGNIVTPIRTTRVTRSKGAPPSGKTPGHITPKKSEREKQKKEKEVHVEDEISEGSEDEEEEDTKIEKGCDKSDENVDESLDIKVDSTENIPKEDESSDKEKVGDSDDNHITATTDAASDNEPEELIINETSNKEAGELKEVPSDKETDSVDDKGDVSDQLAVEDKDEKNKEEEMEEKENSGDNDIQSDSNLELDNVEIEDKHSENNESEKDDDEMMELDEEEEEEEDEGQLCIDELSDEGETKKEVNNREESMLSKGFNSSLKDRTCEFCAVVKKSPADLQRHIRKHTGERPFKCKMCSRMFKAKRSLQYHQFMHHGIKSENSNISQKYSLMRKRKLEMDQLRAELISPDGTKRFKGDDSPDVTMMDGMIRQDGKDSSTSPESGADMECQSDRTCYICGKLCLKPSDLKRHMMCHTGERPFKCDICGKPFRAKNSMLYHKKSAHGFDIELSPGLEERFLRLKKQSNLHSLATKMAHQNVENTPKPIISNGSEVDMEDGDSDETSSIPNLDSYTVEKGNKVFYSCGYTSSFQDGEVELDESTGLFKHKAPNENQGMLANTDLSANSKNLLENSDSMDPPDITEMIKDGSSMVGAEIIHGSHFTKNRISIRNETVLITRLDGVNLSNGKDMCLYKCYLCGKVFNYLSKVQCHLSMHFEKDIVIFQCQLCKASFWFKNQVMQHIRKRHPSEVDNASKRQQNECKNNDADNDTSNSDMDSGIQVKSEGNDENSDEREGSSSPVEGKSDKDDIFKKDSEDRENEMLCRFWRGLKYRKNSNGSYVCLVCRKSFHREISLLKHIKIHSGHKQCYCQECGKGFSEFTALRQHLALFHGLRDSHQTLKPHIKASTKHSLLSNLLSKKAGPKSDTEVDDTTRQSQEERARELLIKEGIQEDVTVVMPCGPDDDTEVDGGPRLLDVWSERDSEESSEANSQDGIITPVLPRRSVGKEMNKSKRKSSQPVKLHNASIPPPAPLQVSIPAPATSAARVPIQIPTRLLINGEAARAAVANLPGRIELPGGVQIKQEPLSPTADVPSTSTSATSNLVNANPQVAQFVMNPGQMILTSGSGSTSGQPQPMMLLSNSAFPSPIPGNIIGMVQVANSANQISGKDSAPSDSSTPLSSDPSPANTEGSDRDTLVGFPRVQWSPNETPPTSCSGFTWSQISADGRKVTSLSRTHSRLPIVNAPVNRDKVCKPMTLTDGRQVYRCPFCSKDFLSYSDINRHMDFHEDIRPYKCKYCDYFARTNSQLKVHMMRHQGIREFCCKVCNYKGVTQSDLNRHMKSQIHILKSRNECNHCGEGFVTQKNLEKHLDGNCIVKVTKFEDTSDFS